MERTKVKRRN